MRWLVIILLLANVVYFGLELDRETRMQFRNTASALPVPDSASRLTLIREMDSPPETRSTQDTIETYDRNGSADGEETPPLAEELMEKLPDIRTSGLSRDIPGAYCISYGPLPEEAQATGLNDWFRSRDVATRLRHDDRQKRGLFWVYLAPRESRQEAMEVLEELKTQGISDYKLIRRGNLKNAISLGLFSNQYAVNERLGELEDKGYKPVVVPYTNVDRVYWLDVRIGGAAEQMNEIINGYPARFNSVPVDCNQIAIDTGEP